MQYKKAKSKYSKYDNYRSTNVINDIRFMEAVDNLPDARDMAARKVYITAGDASYDVLGITGPQSGAFLRAKKCIANETDFMARRAMRRKLLVALILKGYEVIVVCAR